VNPHKHYDLKEVEAAMRRSFRSIAQEPKTNDEALYAAACQRTTDIHIKMVVEAISLGNDGVPPQYIVQTLISTIGNLASFIATNYGRSPVNTLQYVFSTAFDHAMHAMTNGESGGDYMVGTQHEVGPVQSGRA